MTATDPRGELGGVTSSTICRTVRASGKRGRKTSGMRHRSCLQSPNTSEAPTPQACPCVQELQNLRNVFLNGGAAAGCSRGTSVMSSRPIVARKCGPGVVNLDRHLDHPHILRGNARCAANSRGQVGRLRRTSSVKFVRGPRHLATRVAMLRGTRIVIAFSTGPA